MKDRRHDKRLFCADLVEVRWQQGGREQRRIANLEDISPCGVCLLLESDLPLQTPVVVRCGVDDFDGFVRHSSGSAAGFLIGVQFAEDTRWSMDHYRPEHLLDPQELLVGETARQTTR
jgi:hypothetical protein